MLNKVKALPHKITFAIGLSLVLVSSIIGSVFPNRIFSIFIDATITGIGVLFILIASDKRHSNIDK